MWKIALPVLSIIILVIGLAIGILLGSILGRVGSLQILSSILKIPAILIKSPKELKSKWRMWQELRDSRRMDRLKRIKEINALKDEIRGHKGQIKKIKAKIRMVKWESNEAQTYGASESERT